MFFSDSVNYAEKGTYLFSLGQAGYIIKSRSGQLLAIDPYMSDCVERLEGHIGYKRLLPKILNPSDLLFDGVIATHEHWDHFDMDAMPEMMRNGKTILFTSVDCDKMVQDCQIAEDRVCYIKSGDIRDCGDFKLRFVNCDHGDGAPDAVGVVVEVDGKRIYETGDTCLRLDWVDEIKKIGNMDIMIAPINGAYGNLNESECAQLSDAIEPKITIPCHYGMFASHGGNVGKFYELMKNEYPQHSIFIMTQGEMFRL